MKKIILVLLLLTDMEIALSIIRNVGPTQTYTSLTQAVLVTQPGDTIMVHTGTYTGGVAISNLQGTAGSWIRIFTAPGSTVVYQGGPNGWQMTDAAYIHIRGFIFQQQTGNGFNMDDGGSYNTPSHHIIFENCIFRNINATGNNDLLKLSGVDDFTVRGCSFINGSFNGSAIDMVGCHNGIVSQCTVNYSGTYTGTNVGNGFQAKGGSANITFERNFLNNAGPRSFNLGGSTGAPYFRPSNAPYEASNLRVYSNIIIGSDAPIAFVGCINSEAINNTIYLPKRWTFRILQENTSSGLATCANNKIINNIVYRDNQMVSSEFNIGSNTSPTSFTISHNLWFHSQNTGYSGPANIPVTDPAQLIANPMFINPTANNFGLQPGSPAIGSGSNVSQPNLDFYGNNFNSTRSRGAIEGNSNTTNLSKNNLNNNSIALFPNPVTDKLYIRNFSGPIHHLTIFSEDGKIIFQNSDGLHHDFIDLHYLPQGIYLIIFKTDKGTEKFKILKQ